MTGGPGKTSVRVGWGKFYSTFEGATNFNEIGDAPFGAFYGSPVPPQFVTPFVDRGTGNVEGQRFPVPLPTTIRLINWANFLADRYFARFLLQKCFALHRRVSTFD